MSSRSINRVVLLGNLGRDADTKLTSGGYSVTRFSVATNRQWKDAASGEWKEETDWVNVVMWGHGNLTPYLTKGRQVYIEGRVQTQSYQDRHGASSITTEVIAEDVILLGSASDLGRPRPAERPSKTEALGITEADAKR